MESLRSVLRVLLGAALVVAQPCSAQAAYPSKPVKLVVPFSPGGTTDIVARILAAKLAPRLGQQLVIENRGGAGGNIGADIVARAAADGYTLLMGSTSNIAINPILHKDLPYDPIKSFSPVALVAVAPHVMVVNTSLKVRSVGAFIEFAKANPGELTFGSGGIGTPTHLAGELFKQAAGVEMRHVPYKGSNPALVDLMAGRLTVVFDSLPAALGLLRSGKLKALAQTGSQRSKALPDAPRVAEAGLPGFEVVGWFGLLAPQGTAPGIVKQVNADVQAVLADADTQTLFAEQGAATGTGSPPEFAEFIRADIEKWRTTIMAAKVKLE